LLKSVKNYEILFSYRTGGFIMKKFLLASAAFIAMGMSAPASAADMPVKAVYKAPPVYTYSWTGCYVGANGGWAGSRDRYTLAPSGTYLTAPGAAAPPNAAGTGDFAANVAALTHLYDSRGSGGLIGAQVGCNYQVGSFVFGGEADWQWTGLKTSADAGFGAFPNVGNPAFTNAAHTEHVSSSLRSFGTIRGRAGFAWDRLFVYGTGGLAMADLRSETNVTFATFPVAPVYNGAVHVGSTSLTKGGWVVGGGAEYAFASNWSLN
jgi:outer membrane immunogenic protein